MESRISLALAEKLRRIYEKEDTFLTFPLGLGFPNRSLGFMLDLAVSGLGAADQLREKVAFSRNLNIVPTDSAVFPADASEPLWDRTLQVLRTAVFAKSGLTAEEERRLTDAMNFLTDTQKLDGGFEVPVNSAIVIRYYTFKMAYDSAEAMYLDEKITAETSTGPEGDAIKARWVSVREKQMKDAVQVALDNWNTLGQAIQVKAAIQTKNELEAKKYLSLYREAFENDIELAELPDMDARGLGVYATFFSPFDIFDQKAAWSTLTLTRTELDGLVETAAPALKALFGTAQGTPIEAVSLDYANVTVIRPWFRPEFFASRTWRSPDDSMVSDGEIPRKGTIPAYITSMLATRNITITRAAGAPTAPMNIPILMSQPLTTSMKGDQLRTINQSPVIMKAFELGQSPPIIARPAAAKFMVAPAPAVGRLAITPALVAAAAAPVVTVAKPVMAVDPQMAKLLQGKATFIKRSDLVQVNATQLNNIQAIKYEGTAVAAPPASTPPPPPAPVPPTQEKYGFDGVIVLAYVCRRVPRSPNPDESLPW